MPLKIKKKLTTTYSLPRSLDVREREKWIFTVDGLAHISLSSSIKGANIYFSNIDRNEMAMNSFIAIFFEVEESGRWWDKKTKTRPTEAKG